MMKQFLCTVCVWLALVVPAWANCAFISGDGNESTDTSSIPVVLSSTTTGTLIWVGVSWVHTADDTVTITVTDGSGMNTYAAGTQVINPGAGGSQGFYAINAASSSIQITATMTNNTGNAVIMAIHAVEASGVDPMDPLDDEDGAQADGVSSLDVGTLTGSDAGGCAFTVIQTGGNRTFTVPTNYTAADAPQHNRAWAAYRLTGSAGSYGATWTWSGGTSASSGIHMLFNAETPSGGGGSGACHRSLLGVGC